MKNLAPVEFIRSVMDFNPDTGKFLWKPRTDVNQVWNSRYAGTPALDTMLTIGYMSGTLLRKRYLAHRVAWAYYYGSWPESEIDHINMVRHDNRISNLRPASKSENMCNRGKQSNNTSGFKGVSFHKATGKWDARICVNNNKKFIGLFETPKLAHDAYCQKAKELHKEFMKGSA